MKRRTLPPEFWDGVAVTLRWALAAAHLAFAVTVFLRPDLPRLLPVAYNPFDEVLRWPLWGAWNLTAALLLIFVPTRVPLGLISTAFSAYLSFCVAAVYAGGAGLTPSMLLYLGTGAAAISLFGRALWAYMTGVGWFRRRVLNRGRGKHGPARP